MNSFLRWILLLTLSADIAEVKGQVTSSTRTGKDVCTSEVCVASAVDILNSMDQSVDPCEDFYTFACGGWMEVKHLDSNVLKSTRMEIVLDIIKTIEEMEGEDSLTPMERKVVKIFNTCKNYETFDEDTIQWFEKMFEKIGGLPMLSPSWKSEGYDWVEAFSQLSNTLNWNPLLFVDTTVEDRNSSRNILMISQPSRGEAARMENSVLYPLLFDRARGNNITVRKSIIDVLYLKILQEKLDSVTKYEEETDDMNQYKVTMNLKDLQKMLPSIDWLAFFRKATGGMLTIHEDQDVVVRGKEYLVNLIEMIDEGTITNRMIANFLGINAFLKTMENFLNPLVYLIKNYRKYLSKRSVNEADKVEDGRQLTREETQKMFCAISMMDRLNFAIDHIILKRTKQRQSNLRDVVHNLRISLKQIIKSQQWIDEDTKEQLLEKQRDMAVIYDYPEWIIDPLNIEKFYEDLPEVSESPLENFLIMSQFARRKSLEFIDHRNDRLQWPRVTGLTASFLNAYYMKNFNTIILPYALNHPSVYHEERPEYLNYGGIGMIVGHEMGHGFDKNDIQRDKFGNLKNWTNEEFMKSYLQRSQCLVEQYSNYTLNDHGYKLNGLKTLSQNIADLIGVRASYRAFRRIERLRGPEPLLVGLEEYTPQQLFFINFATRWCETKEATSSYWQNIKSDHSPSKFRVLGTLSNMKEFSKAFNCKENSKMNSPSKCYIF